MLPNGRLRASALHPVSSIAHKEVSEATIIMSKSSKKKKNRRKASTLGHCAATHLPSK